METNTNPETKKKKQRTEWKWERDKACKNRVLRELQTKQQHFLVKQQLKLRSLKIVMKVWCLFYKTEENIKWRSKEQRSERETEHVKTEYSYLNPEENYKPSNKIVVKQQLKLRLLEIVMKVWCLFYKTKEDINGRSVKNWE